MLNEKNSISKSQILYDSTERTFTKWHNYSNSISDRQGLGLAERVWLRGIQQLIGGDGTVLHADCDGGYSTPRDKISQNYTHVSARTRMYVKTGDSIV